MRIIRSPRPAQFEVLDKRLLQDARLSFRARGLLAYLLSLPDRWITDSRKLAQVAREGRDAIRAALRELEQCGYLIRNRVVEPTTGTWSTEMIVRDSPEDGFPGAGKPGAGKPGVTREDQIEMTNRESTSVQALPSVHRAVTRDDEERSNEEQKRHKHEPNAVRAIAAMISERHLPFTVAALLTIAYRVGHGDPWDGYLAVKAATEQTFNGARDPGAVLRKRLDAP